MSCWLKSLAETGFIWRIGWQALLFRAADVIFEDEVGAVAAFIHEHVFHVPVPEGVPGDDALPGLSLFVCPINCEIVVGIDATAVATRFVVSNGAVLGGQGAAVGIVDAAAFIIGGVIWGLWHAPLTCIGHNYGTEYPGFPYLGILMMCIFCTLMGIILTFVTEKSGSVWPAAIMHAVNNTNPSILNGYIDYEKVSGLKGMLLHFAGRMIVMVLIIVILAIVTGRKHNTGVKEKSHTT